MGYSRGPYAEHAWLPAPTAVVVPSSNEIDPVTRTFVTDSNGNPGSMGDVAQRVILAISYVPKPTRGIIDDRAMEERRLAIRKALAALDDVIVVERIVVERDSAGSTRELVEFTDLTRGEKTTFERTS